MNPALQILVEGEADTVFIELLGYSNTKAGSSGQVANLMKEKLKHRLVLGIVDKDKGKMPKYFNEFELQQSENDLLLKKHKDRKQYLIFFDPPLESWLLRAAEQLNIEISKYGFSNLKQLQRITKNQNVKQHQHNLRTF